MEIPPFSEPITITDIGYLIRTRLAHQTVMFPSQGARLLGYMAQPNDGDARDRLVQIANDWSETSGSAPFDLHKPQIHWGRVADLFNIHDDMHAMGGQKRRGGASIGKAKTVVANTQRRRGGSEANLSTSWSMYKDVAHVVAAAVIVSAEVRERIKVKPFGPSALPALQMQPSVLAIMLPELVLSLGLYFQDYGLRQIPYAREEPLLDAETLWRIPADMNVTPIPPPIRKLDEKARAALRDRRAGNRGKRRS
jgi:hypothetical protein